MLTDIRPFRPAGEGFSGTLNTAVTGVSATISLPAIGGKSLRIANIGTQVVFVRMADVSGGAATVTNSFPMLPNTVETFWASVDVTQVTVIAAAAGSTLYVTIGESA